MQYAIYQSKWLNNRFQFAKPDIMLKIKLEDHPDDLVQSAC